jgi:hypothetical protein
VSNRRKCGFEATHTNAVLVSRRAQVIRCRRAFIHEATSSSSHTLGVVLHHGEQHRAIHDDIKLARTHGCELTKHNVLRHTSTVIKLTESCSLEQNLDSLFEGTTHERTRVVPVDAVTRNGHKHTTLRHDVD